VRSSSSANAPDHTPAATTRRGSDHARGAQGVEEIWTFYGRFVDRPKAPFLEAVRQTDDVFLGRERGDGSVRAFVAARALEVDWRGRRYGILYGAYAGIDPTFRGGHVIQRAGLATFLKYRRRHPLRPAYFLMMSSTYKSYLLMARNLAVFWPSRHRPTPERERALVDLVMPQVAGRDWDPSTGVVRRHGMLRYLEGVVSDDGDQGDPDVAFYGAMNPLQHEGDSLACIAPLGVKNWSVMACRAARRTWSALRTSSACN